MSSFEKQHTLPLLSTDEETIVPCPSHIGPYKIESLFSKGGMSVLYLGSSPTTALPLIIKVLSPRYIQHKEVVDRFLKEAEIISLTDHPNIVKLYGQGKWEKGLYIAMEFVRGISLRQFILQKSLAHKHSLKIILQVAYALCHLHTHGVIHRDLKPENILITENGDVKVIDFGIAQLHNESKEERITQRKRIMGTPVYMSPEQKEDPKSVSYTSDIFSLGIIAYELFLGRLSHGIIHLSLLPPGLRKILDKALKINPKERYQDIVDFITDISHYLQSNEEERENEEERLDEIIEAFHTTQELLFPSKKPVWPQIEVSIAVEKGISFSGLYGDFFKLPKNQYAIVLSESLQEGISSLAQISTLRGMIRMHFDQLTSQQNQDFSPAFFLQNINLLLQEDPLLHQGIALSLLLLKPELDQLQYASCSHTCLCHIPEESKKVHFLSASNPPLGLIRSPLSEITSNWHVEDTLLLPSFEIFSSLSAPEIEKKQDLLKKVILSNLIYPPEVLGKKILQEMHTHSSQFIKRRAVLLSLQRIF